MKVTKKAFLPLDVHSVPEVKKEERAIWRSITTGQGLLKRVEKKRNDPIEGRDILKDARIKNASSPDVWGFFLTTYMKIELLVFDRFFFLQLNKYIYELS